MRDSRVRNKIQFFSNLVFSIYFHKVRSSISNNTIDRPEILLSCCALIFIEFPDITSEYCKYVAHSCNTVIIDVLVSTYFTVI